MDGFSLIKSGFGAFGEYNCTVKKYKNNSFVLRYNSYSNISGILRDKNRVGSCTTEELERYDYLNMIDVKNRIIDLAKNNGDWQYFVTLTFDDEKVNGYDYNSITKKLKNWLDVQRRKNPNIAYLMVIELHKSGRYHFHGLFKNVSDWLLSPARNPKTGRLIKIKGSQIYNLKNYKLGFTTVSEVKNQEAVMVYISKYITKDLINLKFKKHYWRSKNLDMPIIDYYHTNLEQIKEYIKQYNVCYEKINEQDNYTTAIYQFFLN